MSSDGRDWRDEIADRFAARGDPALVRQHMPQLSRLADQLVDQPTGYDIDLLDLVRLAVLFAATTDGHTENGEDAPRRAAGAAFLHAGSTPTKADAELIARGNIGRFTGDLDSKLARDTWAFMVYRRTSGTDRQKSYSYKPGQELRSAFRDAVVGALDRAEEHAEEFLAFTMRARRQERDDFAVDYADKTLGTASTERRIDRSDARDVNLPDGSIVPLGAAFTKMWDVTNIGQVAWIGRRLTRVTPFGPTLPSSPEWIPIPDTFPGQTVRLAVDFVAARVQGFSTVRFKMTDENGTLYWPSKYPYGLTLLIETAGVKWIDRPLP